MAVKIQVKIFWVVMVCSVAAVYQCFRGPCCPIFRVKYPTTSHGATTQKTKTWNHQTSSPQCSVITQK